MIVGIFAIFLSVFLVGLSTHFIKSNKTADAGGWYVLWWWVGALGSVAVMTAVIVTGAIMQRIYF